jgi:NAD(P)-dependent dehydrogenase (short-subunit alcohol dehydrogenase family)
MTLDFTNRHVVVTGGTGALGAAVVESLTQAGAICHIPAHSAPKSPPARGVNITPGIDLTNESAVADFYGKLPALWSSIHIAGGFAAASVADTSLDQFNEMMSTNAVTAFLCSREAVKKIRVTGKEGGRIVNVASKPSLIPTPGLCAYAASKAAVASLTVNLAEELAAEKIWVNAVVPSILDTPVNRKAIPNADFSKWPNLDEVAAIILFLASPQNTVTRGALVPVYGQS